MDKCCYDIVIVGGGTSGVSAAYIAAKKGLRTLLVEQSDVLGGSITQGLVIPVMKVNSDDINTEFYNDLLKFSKKYNASITYCDNNTGWFNPELLKIVLDDMLKSVNCEVLFSTYPIDASYDTNSQLFCLLLNHKILSLRIETDYIVDSTSNGKIFQILNYNFQEKNNLSQAASLRFILSGVDVNAFKDWIIALDKDRNVTTACSVNGFTMLSTACTWDKSRDWALLPLFEKAIKDGVLEHNDCTYFQLFSVPNTNDSIAFNAPRIILDEGDDLLDAFVYSKALMQGRERIYRLLNFCKKYLIGFENSYISHISDILGVRESYRVKGKYTFTKDDIISPKNFDNIAFACDYPIDIHSNDKKSDRLEFTNHTYFVPIESLICEQNSHLYCAGRIISADFEAHAAIRTQMSCFSMGEAAAKDIYNKLNN